MARERSASYSSVCTVLSCTEDNFHLMFEDKHPTAYHVGLAKDIIFQRKAVLRGARALEYRLDIVLTNMMRYAPTVLGRRYVAVVICLANGDGDEKGRTLIEVAEQWVTRFFIPMLSRSESNGKGKKLPNPIVIPNMNDTAALHVAQISDRDKAFRREVTKRDGTKCVITDRKGYNTSLRNEIVSNPPTRTPRARQWPDIYGNVEAAHIIPWSLNSKKRIERQQNLKDVTATWDILQSWTAVEKSDTSSGEISIAEALSGEKINNIYNGIIFDRHTHSVFDNYLFYFEEDKDQNPNKYTLTWTISGFNVITNGHFIKEVTFTGDKGYVPDGRLLKIHASVAKCIIPAKYPELFPKWDEWLTEVESN
ncbi:hypothetical protein CPC08DRAFT_728120 [Agrocybe pediades]|nr:hypothetical protein CPC08DRAFT_728120 [Agrocybe pediades]